MRRVSEVVRWVLNNAFEGLGRGGWISTILGGLEGGDEEIWRGSEEEEGGAGSAGREGSMARLSDTGEDETWMHGRLAVGDEEGWAGEGELEAKGRLRYGELDISCLSDEGGGGCESGTTLGGVCQESDWERREGGA